MNSPMPKVVRGEEIELKKPAPGVEEGQIFGAETPTERLVMLAAMMGPGLQSGPHMHSCEEAIYVLKGAGKFVLEAQEYHLKPGDSIYLPAQQVHNVFSTGAEPLMVLVAYSDNKYSTTWL